MMPVLEFHGPEPRFVGHLFHGMRRRIPMVKVAYQAHRLGVRCDANKIDGAQRFAMRRRPVGFLFARHSGTVVAQIVSNHRHIILQERDGLLPVVSNRRLELRAHFCQAGAREHFPGES